MAYERIRVFPVTLLLGFSVALNLRSQFDDASQDDDAAVIEIDYAVDAADAEAAEAPRTDSFILLTDPRSGSEWFMDVLDRHPEICASGEAGAEGEHGFHRESLIPARYDDTKVRQGEMKDNPGKPVKEGYVSLLTTRAGSRKQRRAAACAGAEFGADKPGCQWNTVSNMVWRVAIEPEHCVGSEQDWIRRSFQLGFQSYLGLVCNLRRHALTQVNDTTPQRVVSAAFDKFLEMQLTGSLHHDSSELHALAPRGEMLPCKCPKGALVSGQKMMHDWIGDLPLTGEVAKAWTNQPFGVNFNAPQAAKDIHTPYYDLFGTIQKLGTAVITLRRRNVLARYLSMEVATKSSVFHACSAQVARDATDVKVDVDIPKFRQFVNRTFENWDRNVATFQKMGVRVLQLDYEDCVEDLNTCLQQVTNLFGLAPPSESLASSSKLVKLVKGLRSEISNLDEVLAALAEDGHADWLPPDTVSAKDTERAQ